MSRRYYSSTFVSTTTASSVLATDTTVTLSSVAGLPASVPWTGVFERGTSNEDLVTVTAVSGSTLTITRGVDGQTAKAHASGVAFDHVVSARDFDEPNAHIQASTNVHGIADTSQLLTTAAGNAAYLAKTGGTLTGTLITGGVNIYNATDAATNTAQEFIAIAATGNRGLVVRAASGQAANLQEWQNNGGTAMFAIGSAGRLGFLSTGNTAGTVGAAGGASALPAAPFTYLLITIDGSNYKIPVYNP